MRKRALRQAAGAAVAFMLLASAPALAQEPSESAAPSSSAQPPSSASSAPPASSAPEQPDQSAPAQQPEQPPQQEPGKPQAPAGKAAQPNLAIEVSYEDRPYLLTEQFVLDVTITNNGDAEADAVKGGDANAEGSPLRLNQSEWGAFAPFNPGGLIAPGESVQLRIHASVDEFKGELSRTKISVDTPNDADPADNSQEVEIDVVSPEKTSTVGGHLYGDKNANGEFDAGEGLSGVELDLGTAGGPDRPTFKTTTGADGRFDIRDVPARLYGLTFPRELPGGFVGTGSVVIRADGSTANTELRLRGEKPLRDSLEVTAKFNEGPYQPGAKASLTITLSNKGTRTIERIVAGCDRAGFPERHLDGWHDPDLWGDLAVAGGNGTGVTLKPGEARTLQVSGTVPAGSIEHGVVYISCDFGPIDQQYLDGYPGVFVLAKVPGKSGKSSGVFYHDRDDDQNIDEGEPVGDMEVVLIDAVDGKEVTRARTKADGTIDFGVQPAGWYLPAFTGPWQLKEPQFVVVSTDPFWSEGWALRVVPGTGGTGTQNPDTPPANDQRPQSRSLAQTGANVSGLAIGGLALLVVGAAVVVLARKRRNSA